MVDEGSSVSWCSWELKEDMSIWRRRRGVVALMPCSTGEDHGMSALFADFKSGLKGCPAALELQMGGHIPSY